MTAELPTTTREYVFEDEGIPPLNIHEDPVGVWAGGVGSTVWDAGLVLSKYLEKLSSEPSQTMIKSRARVIELGSGTGLVGLVFARCFPDAECIVLTDKSASLPLLKKNLLENAVTGSKTSRVVVEELDWEHTDLIGTALAGPYDVVLLSDCLWYPPIYEPLVKSLSAVAGPSTIVILAYEKRDFDKEIEFFKMFSQKFAFKDVNSEEQNEQWQSEDIFMFRAWLKN
ncbi:putative methyltransferase-domain-containing protein [Jimgerdemannia flammicorona]|uniref:Putative methyltransferase-domain-containing protein n=2 Tax=Jimgerdemannia flammicorona TaxID=994334 RepID=A0A433QIY1_9FUNG|nr:putative methyltransferase-domain-containing protein [Jimgerdemannia flammicorona]RUS29755.1 putative methyltransferase-domain-containing protein [Jimgerdemannia flammicorona]